MQTRDRITKYARSPRRCWMRRKRLRSVPICSKKKLSVQIVVMLFAWFIIYYCFSVQVGDKEESVLGLRLGQRREVHVLAQVREQRRQTSTSASSTPRTKTTAGTREVTPTACTYTRKSRSRSKHDRDSGNVAPLTCKTSLLEVHSRRRSRSTRRRPFTRFL